VKRHKPLRDSADLRHAGRATGHHLAQHCRLRKSLHFHRVFHNAATIGLAEREAAILPNDRNHVEVDVGRQAAVEPDFFVT
jgi:hypothetical protein